MKRTLEQLLTTLDVNPHAFSVCRIQAGWRMTFPAFEVVTVHFVLRGSGHFKVGGSLPIPFSPSSALIIPTRQTHWVGEADSQAHIRDAADQCALLGDGLVQFTAGSGADDTLMLCGALPAPYQDGLSFFDLLRTPLAGDMVSGVIPAGVFDAMSREIADAGFGTQAMCQALMKQALIALLRNCREEAELAGVGKLDPRLSKAVAAITANPAAAHTVDSLASLAGMSRASFSDHFSRTFGQGPVDFVRKARLKIAARLLRTTDLPIKVIAQSAGYAGPRPFSRAFQAAYELGPVDYRKLAEGNAVPLSASPKMLEVSDRPDQ